MTATSRVTWAGLIAAVGCLATFVSAWAGVSSAVASELSATVSHERELTAATYATRAELVRALADGREQSHRLDLAVQALTREIAALRERSGAPAGRRR